MFLSRLAANWKGMLKEVLESFRWKYVIIALIVSFGINIGVLALVQKMTSVFQVVLPGSQSDFSVQIDYGRGFEGELHCEVVNGKKVVLAGVSDAHAIKVILPETGYIGDIATQAQDFGRNINRGKTFTISNSDLDIQTIDGKKIATWRYNGGSKEKVLYALGISRIPNQTFLLMGAIFVISLVCCWACGYSKRAFFDGILPVRDSAESRAHIFLYGIGYQLGGFLLLALLLPQFIMLLGFSLPVWTVVAAFGLSMIALPWSLRNIIPLVGSLFFNAALITLTVWLAGFWPETIYDSISAHLPITANIAEGWNYILAPYQASVNVGGESYIAHSCLLWGSKGSYLLTAEMFMLTGNIASGNYFHVVLLFWSIIAVYVSMRPVFPSKFTCWLIAIAAGLNPIALAEALNSGTDGTLASGITVFCLALYGYVRSGDRKILPFLVSSSVIAISMKNLGIGYLGFIAVCVGVLLVILPSFNCRIKNIFASALVAIVLAGVVNINPLVSNVAIYGNGMFPLVGEPRPEEYLTRPNPRAGAIYSANPDKTEIMDEMDNLSLFLYTQILADSREASAKIDFSLKHTFANFPYIQPFVCGFGSLFKIPFVLFIIFVMIALFKRQVGVEFLFTLIIFLSMIINPQTYQARYVPQAWILPVFASMLIICHIKRMDRMADITLAIMIVGAIIQIPALMYVYNSNRMRWMNHLSIPTDALTAVPNANYANCNMASVATQYFRTWDSLPPKVEIAEKVPEQSADESVIELFSTHDVSYYSKYERVSEDVVVQEINDADWAFVNIGGDATIAILPKSLVTLLMAQGYELKERLSALYVFNEGKIINKEQETMHAKGIELSLLLDDPFFTEPIYMTSGRVTGDFIIRPPYLSINNVNRHFHRLSFGITIVKDGKISSFAPISDFVANSQMLKYTFSR